MTRVAVIQPALALGEVQANLARVEDLVRDAHREHGPEVIVLPEAMASPNVYAKLLRSTPGPIDGQPLHLLARLARELDCVLAGGFVAVRGRHTFGTYLLAEPDGSVHLHDKDIPTAWEQYFYRGGDDPGTVPCGRLGCTVGLMSGWEWARYRTSARVRNAGARVVIGGMCWPSVPTDWPGAAGRLNQTEHDRWREQAAALPGQVARLTGVPVAHASHVGPVTGETPLMPGVAWSTVMIGESQICDRDGSILARLTLEQGEGHVAADIDVTAAPAPADEILDRFWIPEMSLMTKAAWHWMNATGALFYTLRHRRRGFPWQALPPVDLPDEVPPADPSAAPLATG
jgi:predicted amidohydrolase